MSKRVAVAVVAALALAGQPVLAAGSRGGGGRDGGGGHPSGGHGGGGGYHGGGHGGYAVPRGGGHPGYAPGGGVSASRHPSAGYGHYGSGYGHYPAYGRGHYPAYGHGHYPAYGHGYYGYGRGYYPYYPYYPYWGGGYYGNSWGFYLGFGGPYAYGSIGYGSPYAYGYPYGSTNVYVAPQGGDTIAPPPQEDPGAYPQGGATRGSSDYVPNTGRVRLEVRPDDATVYVDDEFWGIAKESRQMTLRAGHHSVELVRPGFGVVRRDVEVVPGQSSDLFVELQRP